MATSRDTFESVIYVNDEQANDAIAKMTKRMADLNAEYENLKTKNGELHKDTLKKKKDIDSLQKSIDGVKKGIDNYADAIKNLDGRSIENLVKLKRQLNSEIKKLVPGTEEYIKLTNDYKKVDARISSLQKAMKEVNGEQNRLVSWGNKVQGAFVTLNGIWGKAITALKGIAKVTKEVINASQTMGDKWNNAMSAMKTTTEAFFMALSSGNWDAFNGGLREAIKNAHRLAEDLDTIGSYQISEGVMQSKYLADYSEQRATALDTDASPEERRKALEQMENDMEHYSAFVKSKGEEVFKTLQDSFEAWKGLTFDSEEEFESFFVRLYEYTNIGKDEAVENLKSLYQEFDDIRNRYYVAKGNSNNAAYLKQLSQQMKDAETSFFNAYNSSTKETQALYKAWELNDKKLKDLSDWFKQYADSVRLVSQYKIQTERTSNRVNKQLSGEDTHKATAGGSNGNSGVGSSGSKDSYSNALKSLEAEQRAEENIIMQKYADGKLFESEYNAEMLRIKTEYLQKKLELAEQEKEDTTQIQRQIIQLQLDANKAAAKAAEEISKEADEKLKAENDKIQEEQRKLEQSAAKLLDYLATPMDKFNEELAELDRIHEAKLISEEEYLKVLSKLREKYNQDDLSKTKDYLEKSKQFIESASSLVTAIKNAELANAESNYQAELTAAGDNAEKREQIEAQYEKDKLDIQKKYADADMAINIAKTTANGAVAAIKAYAEGGPYAGPILAAVIAATTAAEIATIIAQRNAIMNTSVSSKGSSTSVTSGGSDVGKREITGYSEGGYTGAGGKYEPAGIVHRGEWVAPKWMVKQNPVTFANLDQYRRHGSHGRSGSASRGFADGGYAEPILQGSIGNSAPLELSESSCRMLAAAIAERGITIVQLDKALSDKHAMENRFKTKTSR